MTNINGHSIVLEDFDIDAHALAPEYFDERMTHFEEQYHDKFHDGWGEFFAAYSNGRTEKGNLDYDEWAFLCEHFMRKWAQPCWQQPPGVYAGSREKPEIDSGFSIEGGLSCLIRFDISGWWKRCSGSVGIMRK